MSQKLSRYLWRYLRVGLLGSLFVAIGLLTIPGVESPHGTAFQASLLGNKNVPLAQNDIGECANAIIKDVFLREAKRLPAGQGHEGECDMRLYGFNNRSDFETSVLIDRIRQYLKNNAY